MTPDCLSVSQFPGEQTPPEYKALFGASLSLHGRKFPSIVVGGLASSSTFLGGDSSGNPHGLRLYFLHILLALETVQRAQILCTCAWGEYTEHKYTFLQFLNIFDPFKAFFHLGF